MSSLSLGVIGLGRMAKVILQGLFDKGQFKPEEVFAVVGKSTTVVNQIKELPSKINLFASNDPSASRVWSIPTQLLAVKPQQLEVVVKASQDANKSFVNDKEQASKPLLVSFLHQQFLVYVLFISHFFYLDGIYYGKVPPSYKKDKKSVS